jgi:hypothetical protein
VERKLATTLNAGSTILCFSEKDAMAFLCIQMGTLKLALPLHNPPTAHIAGAIQVFVTN